MTRKDNYERYIDAKNYKFRWLALYQELYYYVLPDRDAFNMLWTYSDQGKPTTQQAWDFTAIIGASQRANDLHSLLMPRNRRWGGFKIDPLRYDPTAISYIQPIVDDVNRRTSNYIDQSNLHRVISGANLDMVGGTGALWIESIDDETPIFFRNIPSVTLFLEYSSDDTVETCWFINKISGRKILADYPDYNGNKRKALEDNPNELYAVITGQILNKGKYEIYAFIEEDRDTYLFEHERSYPQIIVFRDKVRPGEVEGRGIGLDLMPLIRDLNKCSKDRTKKLDMTANPTLFYDADNYFDPYSIRQWSNAMIARRPGGRNPIEALHLPEYPEVWQSLQDMREYVRKGFQIDPLGEIDSPVKSATEISIRERRAQRTSATDMSRLINEQPKQIFEVVARILNERGLIRQDGSTFPNFNPKKFIFDYISPLYDIDAQEDVARFVQNCQIKQQFYGESAVLASTDLGAVNEFLTEKLNLPSYLFSSPQKIQQFIQASDQASQQQQLPAPAPSTAPAAVGVPQQTNPTI